MPGDNMMNVSYEEYKSLKDAIQLRKTWLELERDDGMIVVNLSQIVTYGFYKQKVASSKSGIVVPNGN